MIRNILATAQAKSDSMTTSGTIVRVESSVFSMILAKVESPLVVISHEKVFLLEIYKYLTSYKALAFYTDSKRPLSLPSTVEIINAEKIWTPI